MDAAGGGPKTVRFQASEHAWMLTCSPFVASVSSREVGEAENLTVISFFAMVRPVSLRST
jgi:hypothetical protein